MRDNKNKRPEITPIPDYGKVPPQAVDMEEAVLGAVMLDKEAVLSVTSILKPESFYKDTHQRIFRAIVDLAKKNNPVDLYTVSEELRNTNELENTGGPIYLTQLTSKVASAAHVEYHARIVSQKHIQREYIRIGTEIQNRAFDDSYDVAEVAEYAEMQLLEISGRIHRKEATLLGNLIDSVITIIEKIINKEIKLIGVPSGFTKLDRVTGGFKAKELTIIAGRPGMGKTAIALQIAKNASIYNNQVGLFSCEMSDESIARRYLSNVSGLSNVELLTGKCDIEKLLKDSEQLLQLGIYIDDSSNITITELKSKTRRLILKHGIKLLIVDYLQLMKGEGQSREQEVSSISRGLKGVAKDLDIAVIALSQINRESESRKDKKPQLSDLRESGAIEQDADMVMLLYRPAYYGITTIKSDNLDVLTNGLLIVDIAKNRNGATGEFNLKHNVSLTEIYEETELPY